VMGPVFGDVVLWRLGTFDDTLGSVFRTQVKAVASQVESLTL